MISTHPDTATGGPPEPPTQSPTEQAASELPRAYYERIIATHDSIDKVQQSISAALQQIDKNFSDCYKCALSLYQELAQYHALQLETRKALETWNPLFTAVATNASNIQNGTSIDHPSTPYPPSGIESQDNDMFFSALGASPLREQANTEDTNEKNEAVNKITTKDGTLIDPITPKANTLLFHYLRRASLVNYPTTNENDEILMNAPTHDDSDFYVKISSSSISPPTLESSGSMVPPTTEYFSDESFTISQAQNPNPHMMDFSPRFRRSSRMSSPAKTSLLSSSPVRVPFSSEDLTPKTPPYKDIGPEPTLALSMERLSVQTEISVMSPKTLQFPTPTIGMYATLNEQENDQRSIVEEKEIMEFSLDHFPIVFQSGEGAKQLNQIYQFFTSKSSLALSLSEIVHGTGVNEDQATILLELLERKHHIRYDENTQRWSKLP